MIEESSKTLKVLLGILLVILIATVVYVFLVQRGAQKASTVVTPTSTKQVQTNTSETPTASAPVIPLNEAQTQMKAIQDQANAGTLTPEEAKKKLEALSVQVAPPTIPADVLKQLEAQKKK